MQQRASVIMDSGTKIACAAFLGHVPLATSLPLPDCSCLQV